MLAINILGGVAVLGSYVWELTTHPGSVNLLWGGVPNWLRNISTGNMFLAAFGYLVLTAFLFFTQNSEITLIKIRGGFNAFNVLYAAILIPSALWMPLTFSFIANQGGLLWLMDCLVLFLVGFASLGMFSALLLIKPRKPAWFFWLALTGSIFLSIQTVLLDALVWTYYFLM